MTSLFDLPVELIQLVAQHSNLQTLQSLASASHGTREVLVPLLFESVFVNSFERLNELRVASQTILSVVRNLRITVDVSFFDVWVANPGSASLATILSRTSMLRSFSIRISDTPYDTPWTRFGCQIEDMEGLTLGLQAAQLPIFQCLEKLDVQAVKISDLTPLLSRTPGLIHLSMTTPYTLEPSDLPLLKETLGHVPHLTSLAMSLGGWDCEGQVSAPMFLNDISVAVPSLEFLDLRVSAYEYVEGVRQYESTPHSTSTEQKMLAAVSSFKNLRNLQLPFHPPPDAVHSAIALGRSLPNLNTVSWTRCSGHAEGYLVDRAHKALDHDVTACQIPEELIKPTTFSKSTMVTHTPSTPSDFSRFNMNALSCGSHPYEAVAKVLTTSSLAVCSFVLCKYLVF